MTQPLFAVEDLKFAFAEGKTDIIVVTLPCGCETKLLTRSVNSLGTPTRFTSYCNFHFYEE